MHKLEALRILEAKLKSVEDERHLELADNEDLRVAIDAKAEAQALSAVFDFLKTSKIAPSNSLLRIFMRYFATFERPCFDAIRDAVPSIIRSSPAPNLISLFGSGAVDSRGSREGGWDVRQFA